MVPEYRTIKVNDETYTMIEAARSVLNDILPDNVSKGTAAGMGATLLLIELSKTKANIAKSVEGNIYLAMINAINRQQEIKVEAHI